MASTDIMAMLVQVTIFTTLSISMVIAAGPMCYECDQVAHTRDCRKVIKCGSHEKCHAEMILSSDGAISYKSGCKSASVCNLGGGKRASSSVCTSCCDGDYCNAQLCDPQQINLKKRCFTCEDVIRPKDCHLVATCGQDEVCYTEKHFINKELRYRMGCARSNQCSATRNAAPIVGKKRAVPTFPPIQYCGECCSGSYCNRGLCKNGTYTNSGSTYLVVRPTEPICKDFDIHACATLYNQQFCNNDNIKNLFCKRTCGVCGGSVQPQPQPGTIQTTLQPTTLPTTTQKPTTRSGCFDEAVNCQNPDVLKLVCNIDAKQCRKSCGLCSDTTYSIISSTRPTTTAIHGVCFDPIRECQCLYLEKELQICEDPDKIGDTFCCYFCKRKNNPSAYSCPDQICKAAEANELERVKNLNITCLHGTG